MADESFDNSIFPDIATPEAAARKLAGEYGERAADAAASAAFAARADRREKDYRFWLAVLVTLHAARPHPAGGRPAPDRSG